MEDFSKEFSFRPQRASRKWSFKCKRKPSWNTSKFKAHYFVIRHVQKRLSPELLKYYYTVVQWDTVKLMLIFQCILGLKSKSIDFKNAFAQTDITSGEPVFIELPRYFRSDLGQYHFILRLNKSLYGHKHG